MFSSCSADRVTRSFQMTRSSASPSLRAKDKTKKAARESERVFARGDDAFNCAHTNRTRFFLSDVVRLSLSAFNFCFPLRRRHLLRQIPAQPLAQPNQFSVISSGKLFQVPFESIAAGQKCPTAVWLLSNGGGRSKSVYLLFQSRGRASDLFFLCLSRSLLRAALRCVAPERRAKPPGRLSECELGAGKLSIDLAGRLFVCAACRCRGGLFCCASDLFRRGHRRVCVSCAALVPRRRGVCFHLAKESAFCAKAEKRPATKRPPPPPRQ